MGENSSKIGGYFEYHNSKNKNIKNVFFSIQPIQDLSFEFENVKKIVNFEHKQFSLFFGRGLCPPPKK